ncbi:PIN-like domain-containing protein [Bradyrhizobium sp. HKCCYLS1011]|uniref:PIN-like domain-containing protein n=1 Tax=Bradyrhizobium sp. HKCCYLS1011 TaxID=3420733 RepID=UPI003EBA765D
MRDYRAFMDELTGAVDAPGTRFYLDTSLLMWLIRLGTAAREEFLAWCRSRVVKVPVWAAHELHHHLVANTVGANVKTLVSETQKKIDEFTRLASERADESICRLRGYPGRASFVSEVEQTFAKIREFANVVGDDTGFGAAAEEVIDFINAHLLDSDIAPIVAKLDEVGSFRYGHRIPPGFHDKKPENRFGDVIIWEEILADIGAVGLTGPVDVVFVSRDEKTDWVSTAPMIKLDDKATKPNRERNFDVTLAHPLLVHEFKALSNTGRVYILQPGFLASLVDYAARKAGVRNVTANWLAAAHRPDLLPKLAGSALEGAAAGDTQTEAAAGAAAAAPVPPAEPAAPSAADTSAAELGLREIMGSDVSADVAAYGQAPTIDQETLIRSKQDALAAGTLAPVRFGRLLAELSLSGRSEIPALIPAIVEGLKSRLPPRAVNQLVLGIAATAYFDKYSQLLKRPRLELRATVLSLEADVHYRDAFSRLREFLDDATAELPYTPGSGRQKVKFKLDAIDGGSGRRTLRDVRVADQPVLVGGVPQRSRRNLSNLLSKQPAEGCSGKEIRMLVADEYFIPSDLLSDELDAKKFAWMPDAGFALIDTTSDGGLSALADEEDSDGE